MLKFIRIHPAARSPRRATPGSAGLDLYAVERGTLVPGAHALIPTGIALELPVGVYGRIAPRSGLAVRYGINVHAGVIDGDYRDEIKIALINHGNQPWEYREGERIAQLILEHYLDCGVMEVPALSGTERSGGFGSTGR